MTLTGHLSWPILGLKDFELRFYGRQAWPTNGLRLTLERVIVGEVSILLQSYLRLSLLSVLNTDRNDLRAIFQKGIPMQRGNTLYTELRGGNRAARSSPPERCSSTTTPRSGAASPWAARCSLRCAPTPCFESPCSPSPTSPESPLYIGEDGSRLLFAELDSRFLSFTLAQTLTLTPRLTSSSPRSFLHRVRRLRERLGGHARSARPALRPLPHHAAGGQPHLLVPQPGPADHRRAALGVPPGLHALAGLLALTRNWSFPGVASGSLLPSRLGAAPASDTVQLKLSYAADL